MTIRQITPDQIPEEMAGHPRRVMMRSRQVLTGSLSEDGFYTGERVLLVESEYLDKSTETFYVSESVCPLDLYALEDEELVAEPVEQTFWQCDTYQEALALLVSRINPPTPASADTTASPPEEKLVYMDLM
jgi:hypothetical protein